MIKPDPFEENTAKYDAWFENHRYAYESELHAVGEMIPRDLEGIEIGVGTGRFAVPLGIARGIDPSPTMAAVAATRGVAVDIGVAERLPYGEMKFDFALMVTTICFLHDCAAALMEAHRILKAGGCIVVGFVDKESDIGNCYRESAGKSIFYGQAVFYSTGEVVRLLENAGFSDFEYRQTLFRPLDMIDAVEPVLNGYGKGSFVVIGGVRPAKAAL